MRWQSLGWQVGCKQKDEVQMAQVVPKDGEVAVDFAKFEMRGCAKRTKDQ